MPIASDEMTSDTSTELTAASLKAFTSASHHSALFDATRSSADSTSSTLTSLEPTPKKWRGWVSLDDLPPTWASPPPAGQATTCLARQHDSDAQSTDGSEAAPAQGRRSSPTRKRTSQTTDDDLNGNQIEPFVDEESPHAGPGLYWQSWGAALPASAMPSRGRRQNLDWRLIMKAGPPASFPWPIHYGKILLEGEPEDDDSESDGDDSGDVEDTNNFWIPMSLVREVDDICGMREGKGILVGEGQLASDQMRALAALEGSRKPDPYRHISKNFYVGRKPDRAAYATTCTCRKPSDPSQFGCGEDCINRLMLYACDPRTCPCGERCSNLPLNQRAGVPEGKDGLRVIWTGDRGFGLKTDVPIKAGQYIIEYRGEIISQDESYRRVNTVYKDSKSFYFLDYDGYDVIDAGQRGNAARFINHSCGPNTAVMSYKLSGWEEHQIGVFAMHDIPANTELTYDYGWQDFSTLALAAQSNNVRGTETLGSSELPTSNLIKIPIVKVANDLVRQRCFCASAACTGFLGGKKKTNGKDRNKSKTKAKLEPAIPSSPATSPKVTKPHSRPRKKLKLDSTSKARQTRINSDTETESKRRASVPKQRPGRDAAMAKKAGRRLSERAQVPVKG